MPRFGLGSDPMAGVGNAERLALMQQQYAIQKAQKPTTMDKLTAVGMGVAGYLTKKAEYEMKVAEAQAEAGQREKQESHNKQVQIAQDKLHQGVLLSEEETALLDIPLNAEGLDLKTGQYIRPSGAEKPRQGFAPQIVRNAQTGTYWNINRNTGESLDLGIKYPVVVRKAGDEKEEWKNVQESLYVKDASGNYAFDVDKAEAVLNDPGLTDYSKKLLRVKINAARAGKKTTGTFNPADYYGTKPP
jgi:hypothetical protein